MTRTYVWFWDCGDILECYDAFNGPFNTREEAVDAIMKCAPYMDFPEGEITSRVISDYQVGIHVNGTLVRKAFIFPLEK